MKVDCRGLLNKYFSGAGLDLITVHGRHVAGLAVDICRFLDLEDSETVFVEEAALLHDIGICQVHAPEIGMHGPHPYMMHGILGRQILEREGLPRHALICERHIGVGLAVADIIAHKLPLPPRDMRPQSIAEEIVCFADLFYSKTPDKLDQRKTPDKIRRNLARFGDDKVRIFDTWMDRFGAGLSPATIPDEDAARSASTV